MHYVRLCLLIGMSVFYSCRGSGAEAQTGGLSLAATYFGGTSMDDGSFLILDRTWNVIIGGHSNTPGCPTTAGAFDTEHSGYDEGFLSIVSARWASPQKT